MRLLALDLERYGPFTGRRLQFRPDARLHVVLGPNEAGKSCALAAVTDLLFGIEERTPYDFLHKEEGLRLGAEIASAAGRLAFFRRKGRKNLLSEPGGAALPDDALGAHLGGLTRDVFRNAFGLDADALRKGAEEMLRSEGEVGASLFAAASGLRGVRELARALDAEAAAIHAPRAHKRELSLALERWREAQREAAAARLGPEAWRRLNADAAGAAERLEAAKARRKALAAEASRLRRLRAAAPVLAALDGIERALADYADLPEAGDAAVAALAGACAAAEAAAEREREAAAALAGAERDLAAVIRDEAGEAHEAAIGAVVRGLSKYEKGAEDLPRVEGEAADLAVRLAGLATRLGLADADAVAAGQPTDMDRSRAAALLAEGRELAAERARLDRELAEKRAHLGRLRPGGAEAPALVDPGPLRERRALLEPRLRDIPRRDAVAAALAREERTLDGEALRLHPPPASPDALARVPLPDPEGARRVGAGLDAARRRREAAGTELKAAEAALAEVAGRMEARAAGGDVPDPAALPAARAERDRLWRSVRAAALGASGAPAGAALLEASAAAERATAETDRLADRLLADAARAADHAADARLRDRRGREVEGARAALEEAGAAVVEAEAAWAALWAPLAASPPDPAAAGAWLASARSLVERRAALDERRAEAAALLASVEAVRAPLEALAERLGVAGAAGLDLALVDAQVAARLDALAGAWGAARDAHARAEAAAEGVAAAEAAVASLDAREADWRERWSAAPPTVAVRAGAGLEEVAAALEAWSDAPSLVRERVNRTQRAAGIRRDMAAYEAEARALLAALAPGLDLPAPEAARRLDERARAARDAAVLGRERRDARGKAERARDEAAAEAERLRRRRDELAAAAGLPAGADPSPLLGRLEERVRLRAEAARERGALARAGEGVDEATLRRDLAETGPDEIEGRLAVLAAEEEAAGAEGNEAYAERDRLGRERERVEGGAGAEGATARRAAAAADSRAAARRYAVLRLGALLLDAHGASRRADRQDPTVRRAGELFAGLTGGAFDGLDQRFDDKDQPVLIGRRSGGRGTVEVGRMSEGTRDQLYLALRLAYLEDHAARAEPAPFVGDDLFASFDDARTGHGLEALAAIGGAVQPIVFTHHDAVARLARERLGDAVDVIALG